MPRFPRRHSLERWFLLALAMVLTLVASGTVGAQERPYFSTSTHEMEEPGNLEVEFLGVNGKPPGANRFAGANLDLEYGVDASWTSEFYLDGQGTVNDSTIFTGFKFENRLRPLRAEHPVNPVLEVSFEDTSAHKTLGEVEGHDGVPTYAEPSRVVRADKEREMELRLILSSNFKGWNVSENFINSKDLSHKPWEFGYALAASRPLKRVASGRRCAFCAEKFMSGVEMYGGLGDRYSFGTNRTSQYVAPAINWTSPRGTTFCVSPTFGLNSYRVPRLYRFGVSYDLPQHLGGSRRASLR